MWACCGSLHSLMDLDASQFGGEVLTSTYSINLPRLCSTWAEGTDTPSRPSHQTCFALQPFHSLQALLKSASLQSQMPGCEGFSGLAWGATGCPLNMADICVCQGPGVCVASVAQASLGMSGTCCWSALPCLMFELNFQS